MDIAALVNGHYDVYLYRGGGVYIAADSSQYINAMPYLSSGYPIFLATLRTIFQGNEIYLFVAILIQNCLMAFSIWYLGQTVGEFFELNWKWKVFLYFLLAFTAYSHYFIGKAHRIVMNCIQTEGLSFALYYLFFAFLLRGFIKNQWSSIINSFLLLAILTLVRGQFEALLIVLFVVSIFYLLYRREKALRYLQITLSFIGAMAVISFVGKVYVHMTSGEPLTEPVGLKAACANVLLVTQERDCEELSDETLKRVYQEINRQIEKENFRERMDLNSLIDRGQEMENVHDRITGITETVFTQELKTYNVPQAQKLQIKADWYRTMIFTFLPSHLEAWLQNYFAVALCGLIRSNLIIRPILSYVSLLFYLAVVVMIFISQRGPATKFMLLVLICIFTNVCAVSLITFCLSRYMLYNLAIFYIAFLMLAREILAKRRAKV